MLIPQASNTAANIDHTFSVILAIEVVLLVLVTGAMLFFVVKYNRKRREKAENIEGSTLLEIVWTVIPTLLVLGMFAIGWKSFHSIRQVPKEVMTVKVVGRQWSWLFTYENGRESDKLYLPLARPVKLLLTSSDVIHSFYIPAFRIKEDCVPHMETYMWFTAKEPGTYDIFCTEYCGNGHSGMLSKAIVLQGTEFDAWYASAVQEKLTGDKVLEKKGCLGCHSLDGSKKVGPTFKGLYGSKVEVKSNGKERGVTADEEYLKSSILRPGEDVVEGYPNIMPAIPLTPEELEAVISYLRTLK